MFLRLTGCNAPPAIDAMCFCKDSAKNSMRSRKNKPRDAAIPTDAGVQGRAEKDLGRPHEEGPGQEQARQGGLQKKIIPGVGRQQLGQLAPEEGGQVQRRPGLGLETGQGQDARQSKVPETDGPQTQTETTSTQTQTETASTQTEAGYTQTEAASTQTAAASTQTEAETKSTATQTEKEPGESWTENHEWQTGLVQSLGQQHCGQRTGPRSGLAGLGQEATATAETLHQQEEEVHGLGRFEGRCGGRVRGHVRAVVFLPEYFDPQNFSSLL